MKRTVLNVFVIICAATATISCKNDNREARADEAREIASADASAMEFIVDTDASVIDWKGEKPTGTHTGTMKLAQGSFMANDSTVESGTFVIDMNSIVVTDLEGKSKDDLENHLKGTVEGKEGDFFNVTKYPEATFVVTGINQKDGQTMLQGNLTMKEETKNVEFPVNVNRNGETLELTSETFAIDRTKWNVNFGSKSVFDGLGDKFVNDEIELTINVIANQAQLQ